MRSAPDGAGGAVTARPTGPTEPFEPVLLSLWRPRMSPGNGRHMWTNRVVRGRRVTAQVR